MATHGDIGLSQPDASTITHRLRAVTMDMNSTVTMQEVMTLGDANSSLGLMPVIATAPASTSFGAVVRIAGGPSSAVDLQARVNQGVGNSTVGDAWLVNVRQSTQADLRGTVYQSTATDLRARVDQGVGNSTLGDRWRVNVANSSAGDYLPVRLVDSSGTGYLTPGIDYTNGSTTSTLVGPGISYSNSSNDTMRLVGVTQPFPVQLRTGTLGINSTTIVITSTHSTAVYALVSSAANVQHKVFAFHVTSTHTNPSTLVFMSSNQHDLWHVGFGSGSSGMTGANLAVTPPAYFFAGQVNAALNVRIEGGNSTAASTTVARISFSYITE